MEPIKVTAGDSIYIFATIEPRSGDPDLTEATIFAGVKDAAENVLIPLTQQTLDAPDNDLDAGLVIIRFAPAASARIAKGSYILVICVILDGAPTFYEEPIRFRTAMPAAAAPAINSALVAAGVVGTPFSYQIAASNYPLAFQALNLPAGLSLNLLTGMISGTPTGAGVSNVALGAANFTGLGAATLVLTIST